MALWDLKSAFLFGNLLGRSPPARTSERFGKFKHYIDCGGVTFPERTLQIAAELRFHEDHPFSGGIQRTGHEPRRGMMSPCICSPPVPTAVTWKPMASDLNTTLWSRCRSMTVTQSRRAVRVMALSSTGRASTRSRRSVLHALRNYPEPKQPSPQLSQKPKCCDIDPSSANAVYNQTSRAFRASPRRKARGGLRRVEVLHALCRQYNKFRVANFRPLKGFV